MSYKDKYTKVFLIHYKIINIYNSDFKRSWIHGNLATWNSVESILQHILQKSESDNRFPIKLLIVSFDTWLVGQKPNTESMKQT